MFLHYCEFNHIISNYFNLSVCVGEGGGAYVVKNIMKFATPQQIILFPGRNICSTDHGLVLCKFFFNDDFTDRMCGYCMDIW